MLERHRALLIAVVAAAAQSGCSDPAAIRASFSNLEVRRTVYAMNGSAITLPSAVSVRSTVGVPIDASFQFDIAFDLDSNGVVQVYTQARVASQLAPTHRVGLLVSDLTFDEITRAPVAGFVYDSVAALPIGKTLLVDVIEQGCTSSFLGVNIRAKIAVDSIVPAKRGIYLHVLSNPNCGFRSLVQGTPKD
jgi:hypothetical protein